MSDFEYRFFGMSKDKWSLSEFTDLIEKSIFRQSLNNSIRIAKENKLSTMTMDDISKEVRLTRKCKK